MSEKLMIQSIVDDNKITAKFSDQHLPTHARHGELYVVNGILYTFDDLDNSGIGRWFPLTDRKELYTFTQDIAINEWQIPITFHTDNLEVIVYDSENNLFFPESFEIEIGEELITLKFTYPTKGKAFIAVNKTYDWVDSKLIVGDNKLSVLPDSIDSTKYYIRVNTENFKIDENGDATFFENLNVAGNFTVGGTATYNGSQTISGNFSVVGDTSLKTLIINDSELKVNSTNNNFDIVLTNYNDGTLNLFSFDGSDIKIPFKQPNNTIQLDTLVSSTLFLQEIQDRTNADNQLQTNLDNEITNRTNADNQLQTIIDAEIANRTNAGNQLQTNIDAEITNRTNSDGDLTTLTTDVKDNLVNAINEVDSNINTEIANRTNADNQLQTNIDTEITNRTNSDGDLTTLTTNTKDNLVNAINEVDSHIDIEITNRTNAYNQLQTNIDTEITNRTNADGDLTTLTTDNKDNLVNAINEVDSNLDTEITNRTNADNQLQTNIDTEITNRTNADNQLQTNLDDAVNTINENIATTYFNKITDTTQTVSAYTEFSNDVKIYGNLTVSGTTTSISTEELKISDNIITLNNDIPSDAVPTENAGIEVNRGIDGNTVIIQWNETAKAVEIQSDGEMSRVVTIIDINAEITNRTNADNQLQTNIDAEITNRTNSDGDLTTLTTDVKDNLVNAINEVDRHIDIEITNRTNAYNQLQTNIDTEITNRTNADNQLQTNIDAEITNRTNADNQLQTNIDAEITNRTNADGDLTTLTTDGKDNLVNAINEVDSNLDTEITNRTNAYNQLQTNIDTEITNRTNADNDIINGITPVAKANSFSTARTISISGDATGSVSFDGTSNVDIAIVVQNDSHTHDTRYYTKNEADGKFFDVSGDTITGKLEINKGNNEFIKLIPTDDDYSYVSSNRIDGTRIGLTGSVSSDGTAYGSYLYNAAGDTVINKLVLKDDGSILVGVNLDTVWTSANGGSGSGLDADKLDGLDSTSFVRTDTNSTINGTLIVNGDFSATTITETSSIRYKENVKPIEHAFETVSQLQGVTYDWKDTKKHDIGFIAEEVDKVLPELVKKDENGEVQGMNYSKITAMLVEVVKDQQKQINDLKEYLKNVK